MIEKIRHLMRPFLTILFPSAYVTFIFIGYLKDAIGYKDGLEALGMPLGMIMTYHFLKKSNIDTNDKI